MRKLHFFRLFIIVVVCSVFIFAVQFGMKAALMKLFDTSYAYAANTYVGSISLDNKVKEQAQVVLQQEISNWKASPHVQLVYGDIVFSVPTDIFIFDVTDSIHNIKNGQRSLLTVRLQTKELETLVSDQLSQDIFDQIDMSKLKKDLVQAASSLDSKTSLQVLHYVDEQKAKRTVSQASVSNISPYQSELQQWMSQNETVTIPAKSQISLTDAAAQKSLSLDDDTLSVIASLMYETVLQTNFQIRQRSISIALPAYAKLGTEARIEKGKSDFVFYNPNDVSYTFHFSFQNNTMQLSLEGLPFVNTYTVNRRDIQSIPAREIQHIIIQNETKNDAVTAEKKGTDGYAVTVYREQYKAGSLIKQEKMAQDFYLQVNTVKNVQVAQPTPATQPTQANGQTIQPTQNQNGTTTATTNSTQSQNQVQSSGTNTTGK